MQKKGFTLIELLIVVTIIGILAVALVPRIVGGSTTARDARRMADLQTLAKGLEVYLAENGDLDGIKGVGSFCGATETLEDDLAPIIGSIPSDPKIGCGVNDDYYVLFLNDDSGKNTKFALAANVENDEVGGELIFKSDSIKFPGDSSYDAFVNALVSYDGVGDGYYVIY